MLRGRKRAKDDDDSDVGSINSRTIQLPLPEDPYEGPEGSNSGEHLFGGYSPSLWDGYPDAPQQFFNDGEEEQTRPLEDNDRKNLKALIDDSCLGTKPTFRFKMPWERKGLSLIFKKDPISLIPTPVMTPIEFEDYTGRTPVGVPLPSDRTVRGAYSDVINFDNSLTEAEIEEHSMGKALEKWYAIFSTGEEAWPRGFNLRSAILEHRLDDMRLIFGSRGHGTILRRGSSILQFVKWYKSRYFCLCPFPIAAELVEEYVAHMTKEKKPASALRGFLEALNFCQHVIGMNVSLAPKDLISAKVKRMVEVSDEYREERKQARVLTVLEVEFLEHLLGDERADLTDRYACGCMLFCLYSRSRWSDIRKIYNFISDINEHEGRISGYLECRTRSHKTARLVAKGGLSMPLVAPVWGVKTPPWGLIFLKVCQLAGRRPEDLDHEPLLSAPTLEGGWSKRSVTTSEAGKWIRNILRHMNAELDFTTIHTLKGTPLSWCAKWGLDPDSRTILGHHSTGKTLAECYARDNLSKPLRDFDLVLQQIRTKGFSPDSTRSGMVGTSSIADPQATFKIDKSMELQSTAMDDDAQDDSDSSSTSDSSEDDKTDSDAERGLDPVSAPREWDPDFEMFRNRKSKIVHIVAVEGAESFSCGVRISSDFEKISHSSFLDLRKCKRCALTEPIKTVGQLASGLKRLRTGQ